jgi:tetratricopeptide (TPR) repeat protein
MRMLFRTALVFVGALACATVLAQAPSPFAGRWEFVVKPPDAPATGPSEISFAIIEIAPDGATAKLIDSLGAPQLAMTLSGFAIKGDQLELHLEAFADKVTFTGKRVGDHIEGTASASTEPAPWIGRPTTKDKLPSLTDLMAQVASAQPPDQKAFTAALDKPSPLDREAALKQFLADYPASSFKEAATLQLALTKPGPDKASALRAFIDASPGSHLREQAEYELTRTIIAGPERLGAEKKFIESYPKSSYRNNIYRAWFDSAVSAKPVDAARLTTAIDGMLELAPTQPRTAGSYTSNPRSSTLNTIADRLMANDVLLDRALVLIQEAVTLDGDKPIPSLVAVHMTTLGQVLFKLQRYDEAAEMLNKAVTISGGDGDGETQLFLGKYYEYKKDDGKALDAYLKATDLGSPLDTRASLERVYVKKYGTLSTLDTMLDEKYRAKPKAFEPGHYARPAGAGATRVVLAELFTGAECDPCVSADLAFDGFAERYDPASVAVLVYHLHIPGPDPMTNTDTLARAKYYAASATPTVVFDGVDKDSGGGDRSVAPEAFKNYTTKIEKRLGLAPQASVDGFRARITGTSIEVSVDARLLAAAADRAGHVSLHVALAESDVRYAGSNGIRFHSLVVRKLVGSPQGTALQGDKNSASVSETVDLATLTGAQNVYLDAYEKTRPSFSFKARPTFDPTKFVVVAFVQDDATKEILQAAVTTPVR